MAACRLLVRRSPATKPIRPLLMVLIVELRSGRSTLGALQEAAALQPINPHAWYALGMAYHHSRNPDKVKDVVDHLFRFDPQMTRRLIHDAERSDLAHLVKDLAQ